MDYDLRKFQPTQKSSFRKSNNMQQFMNNVQKNSINLNNLNENNNSNHNNDKSSIIQIFDKQKFLYRHESQPNQLNLSRDIAEISYINQQQENNNSFKFDNPLQEEDRINSSRYQRVKNLISKAKKSSLDNMYKSTDKINLQTQQAPIYQEKKDFINFIKNLKQKKKNIQQKYAQTDKKQSQSISQQQKYNFSKKQIPKDSFLPDDFFNKDDDNLNDFHQDQFKDFDHQQLNSAKYAKQFIEQSRVPKTRKKPSKKQVIQLQTIRQEKHNLFERTLQQQKLNLLINNYEDMKNNFNTLIVDLNDTNKGQDVIIEQLKKIKDKSRNQKMQQERLKKMKERKQAMEIKKQQFQQIKDQINKIKQSNKGLLLLKMNSKIETLQNAVKSAYKSMSQEKQQPLNPNIINYYVQPDQQQHYDFNLRESLKISKIESILQQQNRMSKGSGGIYSRSQTYNSKASIIYPFSVFQNESQQDCDDNISEQIRIPNFAKPYYPKKINYLQNINIRKCLTQKSSVVFENFQFYVTAKYIIDDDYHPLVADIKISNKSTINLMDISAVIYGPQVTELNVRPIKNNYQILRADNSFNFEVIITKVCIEDSGFSVQISYKNDMIKKKINFKVPIPVIQLIKPEFIHQDQFIQTWSILPNQLYISPKTLDFIHIRSHEDLKLILPFTHISQGNSSVFSYGLIFRYWKCELIFLMKLHCFINGKASVHLRTDRLTDNRIKEQILDVMNLLLFSS